MNRRQLALIIILNTLIQTTITLVIIWVMNSRTPDAEELAAIAGTATLITSGGAQSQTLDLPPTATPPGNAPTADAAASNSTAETSTTSGGPADAAAEGSADDGFYVVQAGETLSGIASKLGVSMAALVEANGLSDANNIFSGQRLKIPSDNPLATPTPASVALGTTGLKIRTIAGAGDLANEYVELVNDTDLVFNMAGWRLQRPGGPEYTFGDVSVFPGGSIRLYSAAGTDNTIARHWGQTAPVWSRGATAVLLNAQGASVAEYAVP